MKTSNQRPVNQRVQPQRLLTRTLLATALSGCIASTAFAYKYENGDFSLNVDTTLSYGVSVRVENRDPNLIGKCNLSPCQGFQASGAPFIPIATARYQTPNINAIILAGTNLLTLDKPTGEIHNSAIV